MKENTLYPVFLKLHQLHVLIVGGGNVGLEKLVFMLKSSPDARITLVAPEIQEAIPKLISSTKANVNIRQEYFSEKHLESVNLVLAATNDRKLNQNIRQLCKKKGILINVADTPELCDFYLGSIVTRGNLKVAISTNGQSPTFAKRFRQLLEEILPVETDALLLNLKTIRDRLKGSFDEKVKQLNHLTKELVSNETNHGHPYSR